MPPSSMVCRSKAERCRPGLGVEHKDARAARAGRARLVRVALADDQLVIAVVVEIGAPDGVTPLQRLGDHLARPEPATVPPCRGVRIRFAGV